MKKSDLPAKAARLLLALQVLPYLCLVITAVDVFLARRGLDTGGILSLPVLPGTVITDMGLVDGLSQTFVPVFDI